MTAEAKKLRMDVSYPEGQTQTSGHVLYQFRRPYWCNEGAAEEGSLKRNARSSNVDESGSNFVEVQSCVLQQYTLKSNYIST